MSAMDSVLTGQTCLGTRLALKQTLALSHGTPPRAPGGGSQDEQSYRPPVLLCRAGLVPCLLGGHVAWDDTGNVGGGMLWSPCL